MREIKLRAAQREGGLLGASVSTSPDGESGSSIAPSRPPKASKRRVLSLEEFGLTSDAQWQLTVPARYEDYKNFSDDLSALEAHVPTLIRGRLMEKSLLTQHRRPTNDPALGTMLRATVVNDLGQTIALQAFGRPGYAWRYYEPGAEIFVRGVFRGMRSGSQLYSLDQVEVVKRGALRIAPVYPSLRRVKGELLAERVQATLPLREAAATMVAAATGWNDPAVQAILTHYCKFTSAFELVDQLHAPESVPRGERAQRAARFLSAWALLRETHFRVAAVPENRRSSIRISTADLKRLIARLPFALTSDQATAVKGICSSLRSTKPMTGLLTGDVGTGKTLAFVLPMVATYLAGGKAVLMTPNLLLIQQVCTEMRDLFPEVPICTATGRGGINGDPDRSVVVGSTALIGASEAGSLGRPPDFLVVDEQHKFSVRQREALIGAHTNSLEATATPVPRTAALAVHGAKDLFMLRESPVQKTIISQVYRRSQAVECRDEILRAILHRGEQAAVIYPLVESTDPTLVLRNVSDATGQWARHLPEDQIAVLHGKTKEKEAILSSFRTGKKRLLVASTVLEVGVTLPELKTMLVIGADTFGVVTLHQLRGRLARLGGTGRFMMFTESEQPDTLSRLTLVAANVDGFVLAEKDAEMRGYGDILSNTGTQHGETRTLFQGISLGPKDLSFAADLFARVGYPATTPQPIHP